MFLLVKRFDLPFINKWYTKTTWDSWHLHIYIYNNLPASSGFADLFGLQLSENGSFHFHPGGHPQKNNTQTNINLII